MERLQSVYQTREAVANVVRSIGMERILRLHNATAMLPEEDFLARIEQERPQDQGRQKPLQPEDPSMFQSFLPGNEPENSMRFWLSTSQRSYVCTASDLQLDQLAFGTLHNED